ncbi:MAG TPA: chemotaxis protein CheB [Mycobacteriales bacterium]|nr:chemotaxis protein CheB [Mycobacteriales bacterium]
MTPPDAVSRPGGYSIAALASSAGGINALGAVLGELPADFPAPIVVVQHLDRRHETAIADILGRRTPLSVKLAVDREKLAPGVVYIAPPNHHLLVGPSHQLRLTDSELIHFVRPSADLLFESVAARYGARAVVAVLTGSGQDGATGVGKVKARGGTVIVQDPQDAEFAGMPTAALERTAADLVLTLSEIGGALDRLFRTKERR